MTYGAGPYAGRSYGGTRDVPAASTTPVITDPANPAGSGWRFDSQGAGGPYGGVAYGGGGVLGRPASGGISATADPLLGIVRLAAWWASAPYLRVTRLLGTERTPVRGAYPLTVLNGTRRNQCTNPSAEVDTAGWLAGANTTLSRIVEAAMPAGVAAFRLRATAGGAVNGTVPVSLPLVEGAPRLSFALRLSAQPSGALTATVTWRDSAAAVIGTSVATIATGSLSGYINRWDRTPVLALDPPPGVAGATGGAASGTLVLSVAGMAANGTADIDAVLIEGGTSDGVYFDGTSPFAAWAGTAHASISTLAAVQEFIDAEAPLDVPVSYEVTAPNQPAFRIVSEPVTLPSEDRTWLSSPTTGAILSVTVAREPKTTRAITRGVFPVLGRARPIAVSASRRQSAAGTLTLWAMNFAERDALRDVLDDGSPLLLRAPARLGHGPGEWVSIGDVGEEGPGHGAWEAVRIFDLPYQVVDGPVANPDGEVAA